MPPKGKKGKHASVNISKAHEQQLEIETKLKEKDNQLNDEQQ